MKLTLIDNIKKISITKKEDKLSFFVLILSLLHVKQLNLLHYNSTSGPDFPKYFVYLEYNNFVLNLTSREQGVFYYYLHSWNFSRFKKFLDQENFFMYLDKSIQEVNFGLFIISLIGFYKLLKLYNFKSYLIFYTLIFFNYFPLSIAMRLSFKPEILALACLPWIIYFLENYRKTKNYKCIIFLIPFLVIAISSKGSVLGAFGIFFTLFYGFYLARNISKKLFLCFFVFLLLTTLIAFEDYESNGYNLLQVEHDSKYNNKAKTSFIYYVDVERLIKSPIKFNHSNSLISLTLLDTFGDYFSLFWEEDSNAFQNFRGDFIKVEVTEFIGFPKINFEINRLHFLFKMKQTYT